MSSTLLDRLHDVRCDREAFTPDHAGCICRLANEAADEIERLRAEVQKYKDKEAAIARMWHDPASQ